MNEFEIDIGSPEHGWLPISIVISEFQCEFTASDVLNDPVTELANASYRLLLAPHTATIRFWLEPHWNTLELQSESDLQTLITFSYLVDENDANPELIVSARVGTPTLCRQIASRLRSMHKETGEYRYATDECWGIEFPNAAINAAYDRLRSFKDR